MRRIDWVWAAGLLLKGIGATWDVGWHFRTLRESLTPPHMVNVAGGLLCVYALWYEWRNRTPRTTGPLLIILAGIATFLLAIPVDQYWHTRFGLDLTTWSPAHLMLFYGTSVSVFGVLLLYRTRMGTKALDRVMLGYFVIFLAASVYFPLLYNEYTTVAAQTALTAPESMDPALVAMVRSLDDPIFHGTPKWLYPAYSVAIAVLLGTFLRMWIGRGWAFIGLAGITAERLIADSILGAAGWPQSAIPMQFVFLGAAIELAWLVRAPLLVRAPAGAIAATAIGYAWFVRPITWGPVVPLDGTSWAIGLAASLVAALAAVLLVRRGLRHVERVPEMRSMQEVRDWLSLSR